MSVDIPRPDRHGHTPIGVSRCPGCLMFFEVLFRLQENIASIMSSGRQIIQLCGETTKAYLIEDQYR